MVKINLLPVKGRIRKTAGQKQVLVLLLLLAAEAGGFFVLQANREEELASRKAVSAEKRRQIEALKRDIGDIEKLKREKKELEQQEKVLESLERGRVGPVRVLDDLAYLLTPAVTPEDRQSLKERQVNPEWDSRRLWLRSFKEESRVATILGGARSNDDVAEFVDRLSKSRYFKDVRLTYTRKATQRDRGAQFEFVEFSIDCRVAYTGGEGEEFILEFKGSRRR